MAYEPTVWNCGDVITADKLNKLENGLADCCSGGGTEPLVVHITEREATAEECAGAGTVKTLDRTWQEIYDAFPNVCLIELNGDKWPPSLVGQRDGMYYVSFEFLTDSADGYPVFVDCGAQ